MLEAIRAGAPISRAEISRRAGISKPTVSLALQSLLGRGAGARGRAPRPGGPSYGAVFFEPVPEAALVLGIDVGARFLRGALCDLRGRRARAPGRRAARGADAAGAVEAIAAAARDAARRRPGLDAELIDGVVVGVPGVVERETGARPAGRQRPGLEGTAVRRRARAARSGCR